MSTEYVWSKQIFNLDWVDKRTVDRFGALRSHESFTADF